MPRLVKPDESEPPGNEKARIMLEKVLDTKPINLVVLWEDAEGACQFVHLNGSYSAAKGLVDEVFEIFHTVPE